MAERQIFRTRSLEKMSSPDRLDELLRVVRPHAWIPLMSVGGGIVLVFVWSVFGTVPVTANGNAVLVRPKQVVSFQAAASGSIDTIEVRVGDNVEKGELLATLRLPTLEKQLEQEEARLVHFLSTSEAMMNLERDLAAREREHLETQRTSFQTLAEKERQYLDEKRKVLEDRIDTVRESATVHRDETLAFIEEQRKNIENARKLTQELVDAFTDRLEANEILEEQGYNPKSQVVTVKSDVIANRLRRAELEVQWQELDLRQTEVKETFDSQMDLVKDLTTQLNDLELREMDLEKNLTTQVGAIELRHMEIKRRLEEKRLEDDSQRREIERKIEELKTHRDTEALVKSEYTGRILEISAAIGEHVNIGEDIGRMEIDDPEADLKALAFFLVKDGKKINPGDRIRVSPSTVERERFGAILGKVRRVSTYPASVDAVGNEIGDLEIARGLLGGQSRIEVEADLEPGDDPSVPFKWTSGNGPDHVEVTAGTTAQVRVTIEERQPITLILPFLKELTGG